MIEPEFIQSLLVQAPVLGGLLLGVWLVMRIRTNDMMHIQKELDEIRKNMSDGFKQMHQDAEKIQDLLHDIKERL